MVFIGIITEVFPMKSGVSKEGKPWQTQDYLVSRGEKNRVLLNLYGMQRIEELSLQMGDRIKVEYTVHVNYWNGKYFNVIRPVNIFKLTQEEYEAALNEYPIPVQMYSTNVGDNSMPEGANSQVEPQRHAVEAPVYTPKPEPQPQVNKYEDISDDSLPF